MRKGFALSLEAMMAVIILFTFIILISSMNFTSVSEELSYERLHYSSQDISELMADATVSDTKNLSPIKEYLAQGILTQDDLNKTLLDVIGSFWSSGNATYNTYAKDIIDSVINKTLKQKFGYEVLMNGDVISNYTISDQKFLSRSDIIVSGYSVGKPVEGYSAKASLEEIKGKMTSSYIYFGGFLGQGNISVDVRDIPSDANISSISIEANFGDNFTMYINNKLCKKFQKTSGDFSVDYWIINDSFCLGNITKGSDNYFNINFTGSDITKKYIGGGYMKVTYTTSQMSVPINGTMNYYFPGIEGFINHYDSFYVPGNITSMSVRLHFKSNYSSFLDIGNTTVFNSTGSVADQNVNISNITLRSFLNYTALSSSTIPIRFGINAMNITGKVGNADVILITDTSGSMSDQLNSSSVGITRNDCSNPSIYWANTSRISLAKCLDRQFIDIILSDPNNKVGLVTYSNDAFNASNLTNNKIALNVAINGSAFSASGTTCICCAERMARLMLSQQSNSSRQRFIIVMTDGLSNMRCDQSSENRTTCCSYGYSWSPNYFCTSPLCGSNLYSACSDSIDDTSVTNTLSDACKARNVTNATIYSIGFGPVINCAQANTTLQGIASCGNGGYFASSDAYQLEQIYQAIAQGIVNASFTRQAINITTLINTSLFSDSYISFNYTPYLTPYQYGEISLSVETPTFANCNGSFFVPQQFTVDDVGVNSYSSDYWTNNVFINNSDTVKWKNVFNLTKYDTNYTRLGDPFNIKFPSSLIRSNETNYVNITLGLTYMNISTNCSTHDKAIYTARVKAYTSYSGVFSQAIGKNVTVYYDSNNDGVADGFTYVGIGKDLSNFNPTPITVDQLNTTYDALDFVFLDLLNKLNFAVTPSNYGRSGSSTNPIDIQITPDIVIEAVKIPGIYSLWGPATLEVRVWS